MYGKILVLIISAVLILSPPYVTAQQTFFHEYTTREATQHFGFIELPSGQQTNGGQMNILPSGEGPDLGEGYEIISLVLTRAFMDNVTLTIVDIKNSTMDSVMVGALTFQAGLETQVLMSAVLGRGETFEADTSSFISTEAQTIVYLTASRAVPEPIVPLPLNEDFSVQFRFLFWWALDWNVTYREVTPTTSPTGNGGVNGGGYIPSLSIGTGILIAGACGLVCAVMAAKRSEEK